MRTVVVGGSGLIGSRVATVLRERGGEVTTLARRARAGVDLARPLESASPAELRAVLAGHDAVVFAARTDEQRPMRKPLHPEFRRVMVDPVVRLFAAAREEGLTRGVIMGSYYTYFDRLHPEWRLAERHTYVRCRLEQAAEARAAAGPGLPIAVLELPFIFGPGTNWAGPLDNWARSRAPLFAPTGGTAAASAASVAEAAADALDRADGSDLPIADENLTWREMIGRIAAAAGRPRTVGRLPSAVARAGSRLGGALQAWQGKGTGLDTGHLADLMLRDLYVEPVTGRSLDAAVAETFTRERER
ncbi:NAD(P)-dependent oxidoreductase [Actinoplanes sp. NPDC051470]|uniref:NAD-dependent epimerase/dehydratase family protein n=1 Tax=unclassified Actinoplanes TaxID=2626549 RepID=UPI00342BA6A1